MSEIDRDSSVLRQGFMLAHLAALVKGHGAAHLAVKAFENLAKGRRYGIGLPIAQLYQGDKESLPLDQSPDLRQVPFTDDEISFPVAWNQSFSHFGRS